MRLMLLASHYTPGRVEQLRESPSQQALTVGGLTCWSTYMWLIQGVKVAKNGLIYFMTKFGFCNFDALHLRQNVSNQLQDVNVC